MDPHLFWLPPAAPTADPLAALTNLMPTVLPARMRAAGLLWQDLAETIRATADGDPVRVGYCPYTRVKWTAPSDGRRPLLWDEGGGKWSLSFDGVDDYLEVAVTWAGTAGSLAVRFARTSGARLPVVQVIPAPDDDWYAYDGSAYAANFRAARFNGYRAVTPDAAMHTYTQQSGPTAGYRVFADGALVGTTTTAWLAPTTFRIATSKSTAYYFAGRVRGFVPAAAEWDATARSTVETYLGSL